MSPSEYQDLVQFLGARFEVVDRRFERLERRFDGLEQHLEEFRREVLGHFDELYRRLERLEQEYHAITQALRRLEVLLVDEKARREILERDLATLRENVAVLKARIDDIERRLGDQAT
jgi:uncharacterized membrane-anchored protein YhcB (DUF1043 family)